MSRRPDSGPVRYPFPTRPPWPPEHGAWFAFLINFALGACLSPHPSGGLPLLFFALLAFFLARYPVLLIAMRWPYRHLQPSFFFRERIQWSLAWIILGFFFGGALLSAFNVGTLAPLAVIWVAAMGFEIWAVQRRQQKTALSESIGIGALSLTAVAAYSLGEGSIAAPAVLLGLVTMAYHVQAVFYVRMRIRALSGKHAFTAWRERIRFAPGNLSALTIIWLALAGGVMFRAVPPLLMVAFIPMTARALYGIGRLGSPTAVRRLGLSEVALSIVFSGLVLYTLGQG